MLPLLKILGWVFVPYIMLIFQWKKVGPTARGVAIIWSIILIVYMSQGNSSDEQKNLISDTNNTAQKSETNDSVDLPKKEEKQTVAQTQKPAPVVPKKEEVKPPEKKPDNNPAETAAEKTDGKSDVTLHFPADRYPETAEHIKEAIEHGESSVCTIDREDADAHRDASLDGIPTKKGYDRDEWPMAMCAEGGSGADIMYITPSDNRGAGSWVGNQLEGYTDGTRVLFVIDGGKSTDAGIPAKKTETTVNTPAAHSHPAASKPASKPAAAAPEQVQQQTEVYYQNCTAVRDAGADPIYSGDPGYSRKLDRDGDGVACEK